MQKQKTKEKNGKKNPEAKNEGNGFESFCLIGWKMRGREEKLENERMREN